MYLSFHGIHARQTGTTELQHHARICKQKQSCNNKPESANKNRVATTSQNQQTKTEKMVKQQNM
jgi:hypothetical protein